MSFKWQGNATRIFTHPLNTLYRKAFLEANTFFGDEIFFLTSSSMKGIHVAIFTDNIRLKSIVTSVTTTSLSVS